MKHLTKNLLKINFTGIEWSEVSKIEFAFSQSMDEAPLKTATYPNGGASKIADNLVGIPWTVEETAEFESGKPFYADTRITLSDSYQPETHILKLMMHPTLFES